MPGGGFVAAGFFDGTIDLGGGPLSSQGAFGGEPSYSLFVARFDAKGDHVWSKRYGGPGAARPQAIAVGPKGDLFLAGGFTNTISFGETTLTAVGGTDAFVAALADDGTATWAQRYGDTGEQIATGIGVDSNGDVVFAGALAGTADFGGGELAGNEQDDVFVAKLSGAGAHRWSHRFGGPGVQRALGLAVDGGGNVLVAGAFAGPLDFGGGALPHRGGRDAFVAKLSPRGDHVFSASFGDASDQLVRGIAASSDGRFAIVGEYAGTVDFGPPRGDYTRKAAPLPPPLTGGAGGAAGQGGGAGGKAGGATAMGGKSGQSGQSGASGGGAGAAGSAAVDPLAGDCVGPNVLFDGASGHCYFLSADAKSWEQARQVCAARGPRWTMWEVDAAAEVDFVKAKLPFESAWTGGSDEAKEGSYVWDGGGPLTVANLPWNDGEPNNFGDKEDCVEVSATGKLNDNQCELPKAFVCERGSPWPVKSKGGVDAFVAVFDPNGDKLWEKSWGDGDDQRAWGVTFGVDQTVFVGGDAPGTLDLGSGEIAGSGHAFLAGFDERGTAVDNARFGPGVGQTLALASLGSRVVGGGIFTGSIDIGSTTLTSGDKVGVFVFGR
jgi:hypothetical protein